MKRMTPHGITGLERVKSNKVAISLFDWIQKYIPLF
jgi:hypothetical protein